MVELDREMARLLGTDHPYLESLAERIMAKPGKRLRPKLLVLCSKMLGYQGQDHVVYATIFELIHTATLIHDDIIDEAKTRRGLPSMNSKIGNTLTVLYGDLLYTKSHTRAVEAGRLDVLHTIDWVSERMIEGELLQNKYTFDMTINEEIYFDILKRKTAYLFAGTTKTAGLIANLSDDKVQALYDFGFQLGVSFQLMDDYLDYTGNASQMGKPVLSDLKEGKVTLPMIHLLQQEGQPIRDYIEACWQDYHAPVPSGLLDRVHESQVLSETLTRAEAAARKAVAHLDVFEDNRFRQLLQGLPLMLLSRRK